MTDNNVQEVCPKNKSFIDYFKQSETKKRSSNTISTHPAKQFSFRKVKESPYYDNSVFSRFFENYKTITAANLPSCQFDSLENFLDSKFPTPAAIARK